MMMEEQDLKTKVIETLKTKGYHESQLKELNPIIQATIDATKQALNLHIVSVNEVAVCEDCMHYNKGEKLDICKRCFGNSHFVEKTER